MGRRSRLVGLLAAIALGAVGTTLGCGSEGPGDVDATPTDGSQPPDTSVADAGTMDGSTTDSSTMDAGATDSSATDSSSMDAGATDSSATDSGAGATDSALVDAPLFDAGPAPDAGPTPASPVYGWSRSQGGTSFDQGLAVAVAPTGEVYVTGRFQDVVDFGDAATPLSLTSRGRYDIFVLGLSRAGAPRWARAFGARSDDYGSAVTVDASGNVYVTGRFVRSVDFGGGVRLDSNGLSDVFVASYDSGGAYRWAVSFGSVREADGGNGIAVDDLGNVYVTGVFGESVDFGGGLVPSAGDLDVFVASFRASDGVHQWSRGFGGASEDIAHSITAGRGSLYLTGVFQGTAAFGGAPLRSAGDTDIFVTRLRATDGAPIWAKGVGSASADVGKAIAVDWPGNVYVTGYFGGTVDFGGAPLVSDGPSADVFLASYATDGGHRWSHRAGGTVNDQSHALAVDPWGAVYITGSFQSTADFGGGPFTTFGTDIFAAKYAATDGAHLWSQQFGASPTAERALGIAASAAGDVLLTGWFQQTRTLTGVDFGGGAHLSEGGNDIFVLSLAPM